jgi:hypothetical protein
VEALGAALERTEALAPTAAVAYAEPDATPIPAATPNALAQPEQRSHQRRNAILAGALIVLVLLAGGLAFLLTHQETAISLSSTSVMPGQQLVVSATHVPPNQTGVVQILSQPYNFPFVAGPNGGVNLELTVPADISLGDHIVRICWNSACHAPTVLHVVSSVAQSTPTPSASPSGSSSASASPSPTPGASSSPRTSPQPRPYITISKTRIQILVGSDTVSGFQYLPGRTIAIRFLQSTSSTNANEGSRLTGSTGQFTFTFTIPKTAKLGPARIEACGYNGCLSATVDVTATG